MEKKPVDAGRVRQPERRRDADDTLGGHEEMTQAGNDPEMRVPGRAAGAGSLEDEEPGTELPPERPERRRR